jgi:hypothetical protein
MNGALAGVPQSNFTLIPLPAAPTPSNNGQGGTTGNPGNGNGNGNGKHGGKNGGTTGAVLGQTGFVGIAGGGNNGGVLGH